MSGWRGGLLVLWLALLLSGCSGGRATRPARSSVAGGSPAGSYDDIRKGQGSRYRAGSDSVPSGPPPDISAIPEPVPKLEPRSLYGNKSPYTVLGQTYTVLPTSKGYVERGIASFYGNKFHGYKTSNLEDYDMYKFTAASKTLPLPSYARVTNLQNGKSVIVRVNDRGPFHDDRVIDLSYVAAVKIGVWPKGTGLVEVRAIDPAHPEDSPPPAAIVAGQTRLTPQPGAAAPAPVVPSSAGSTSPVDGAAVTQGLASDAPALREDLQAGPPVPVVGPAAAIYLQVGAFSDAINAGRVADQLRRANFAPVQVIEVQIGGRTVRRVRVGPLADVDSADQVSAKIEAMGLPRPQVAVD
ncbi:MAG: septal ring lytic transglycosylase RlpA family protein [Dyella sp.]